MCADEGAASARRAQPMAPVRVMRRGEGLAARMERAAHLAASPLISELKTESREAAVGSPFGSRLCVPATGQSRQVTRAAHSPSRRLRSAPKTMTFSLAGRLYPGINITARTKDQRRHKSQGSKGHQQGRQA